MSYTTEQFERLPKWAKDEIKILTNRLDHAEIQLKEISGTVPTNMHWSRGMGENNPIPNGSEVSFRLEGRSPHRNVIRCRIATERGIEFLKINGDDQLLIIPNCSNDIGIKLD